MKQDFIATCVEDFFFSTYKWNFQNLETADGQQFFDILSDESEDLQNIAESYNKEVGKDVLRVALIRRKNGGRRWEIQDRYPTSWNAKDADYMVVLLVSSAFNEDKIEDLEDLAYYLNGCWTEGGNDPCNFISEWCDHNSCIYTEDDDTYEFAGEDFAYSEWDEELLTMADDGSFIVVDHKAEPKDK